MVLYNIHSENKARNKEDFVSLQSDSCNPDGDNYVDYSALDSQHEDLSDSEERIIDKRPGATTYELIALGPPGVQTYQELRNCLLDINIDDIGSEMSGIKIHEHMVGNSRCQKGFRRRDLHKEFVDSRTLPSEFVNDSISSIRVALQTTNLIFQKSRCVCHDLFNKLISKEIFYVHHGIAQSPLDVSRSHRHLTSIDATENLSGFSLMMMIPALVVRKRISVS